MDQVGAAITRRERLYERIFSGGWGDLDLVPSPLIGDLANPEMRTLDRSDAAAVDELRFSSPLASHLQRPSVNVLVVRPREADRIAVLLPAFNDHGYTTRRRLADQLATFGIATAIIEGPLYGARRLHEGQVMREVSDFLLFGSAGVSEALTLARWLGRSGWRVALSGYSMGGSMAAYAGALASAVAGERYAIAPLAAAHAPSSVYCDAALSRAVAWDRLGPAGRERLRSTLEGISTLNLDPPPGPAVLLSAAGDGYVPPESTRALARHWPGSELRVVSGGHASLQRRVAVQAAAIRDALQRI